MAEIPQNKPLTLEFIPYLDAKYRDVFNMHITPEDVVLEFGNLSRHEEGKAIIHERLVLSPSSALRLQQWLSSAISQMQEKMRRAAENAAHAEKLKAERE